jgi:hypothetical protein
MIEGIDRRTPGSFDENILKLTIDLDVEDDNRSVSRLTFTLIPAWN